MPIEPTEPPISAGANLDELKVFDHGFVRLDDSMATDLSVINSARVSFAVRKEEMEDKDAGLIKFLMRDRHGSPFEHNSFRFHIRTPIFVAREWFRHRIGCLTGDTVVKFEDNTGCASASNSKTLEELFIMWNFGRAEETARLPLRVLNEGSNEFTTGHVSGVVDKGKQPVYEVTLLDGKKIKATENHRFLTTEGWLTLGNAVGFKGTGGSAEMTRACEVVTNGSLTLDRATQRDRLTGRPVAVVSIEYLGMQQTYDVCVEGPWHNFVANGIVVHNSFNEESARYHKLADDFYVPDPSAVRGQVGKPGAYTFETVDDDLALETRERLQRIYSDLYAEYNTMMEQGVAKELARSVLPFGIYTQFYWTLNARSLMNFLSLRNSEFAQYEIRVYAEAVERFFAEKMPVTHACFVEFGRRSP